MNNESLISVIIPTYNRAKTILVSVNSVLNQTYKNIELFVVDDCSTDNTIEILNSIQDPRLKILKHDVNKGQNSARNTGIKAANGVYIAHHDSDDVWHSDKIEKQLRLLLEKDADIICCQTAVFDDETDSFMYNHPNTKFVSDGFIDYSSLLKYNCTTTQTFFGKAECFKSNMFDPEQPRFTDWDISLQLVQKYKFYFKAEVMADVFQQKDSITKNPKKGVLGMERLFEKHKDKILSDKAITESFFKKMSAFTCLTGGNPVKEMTYISKANPSFVNKLKLFLAKIGLYRTLFSLKNK